MAEDIDTQLQSYLAERRQASEREAERLRREIAGLQASLDELEAYLHGIAFAEIRHGKDN